MDDVRETLAGNLPGLGGRVTVWAVREGGVKNDWRGWVDGGSDCCPGEDKQRKAVSGMGFCFRQLSLRYLWRPSEDIMCLDNWRCCFGAGDRSPDQKKRVLTYRWFLNPWSWIKCSKWRILRGERGARLGILREFTVWGHGSAWQKMPMEKSVRARPCGAWNVGPNPSGCEEPLKGSEYGSDSMIWILERLFWQPSKDDWGVIEVTNAMVLSKVSSLASCSWKLLRGFPVPEIPSPCSSGYKRGDQNIYLNRIYQPQIMWEQTHISLPLFGWSHTICIWELFPARK